MTTATSWASMSVPADLIDAVKPHAEADGMTVASWIRHIARQEVERRREVVTVANPAHDAQALDREARRLTFASEAHR